MRNDTEQILEGLVLTQKMLAVIMTNLVLLSPKMEDEQIEAFFIEMQGIQQGLIRESDIWCQKVGEEIGK